MRVAGIIAEYNPFHNGHACQIRALRKMGYDAVICVCSPSVAQRGTFTLFPAQVRTRAALAGGADLVLSLPAPYATRSAEGFAAAGVGLLAATGVCESIAFGAETPSAAPLQQAARLLRSDAYGPLLRAQLEQGLGFAAARAAALEQMMEGGAQLLRTCNNILGVEYCKALEALQAQGVRVPRPLPLPRTGAQHDAPLSEEQAAEAVCRAALEDCTWEQFASATSLRGMVHSHGVGVLAPFVPTRCLAVYQNAMLHSSIIEPAACNVAVLSRLRAQTPQQLARVRGVNEGLEHRLYAAVRQASTLPQLYDLMKTKRYAHARMRRLVLDAALGYTDALPAQPPYLHVLGATHTGLRVLGQMRTAASLPVSHALCKLERTGPAAAAVAQAHAAAEDLAALCLVSPAPMGTAYTSRMIVMEDEE